MRNFFVTIYRFFERHRIALWAFLGVLLTVFVFGILRLRFVEDISSFFPNQGDNQRVNYAYQHIGADNRILLNVKLSHPKDSLSEEDYLLLTEAADTLATHLRAHDKEHLMKDLTYQVNQQQVADIASFVVKNMPYFLTEADYQRMDSLMTTESIEEQLINDQFIYNSMTADVVMTDPLFFSAPVLQKLEGFRPNDQYHEQDGYIFNKEGTEAIVVVTSKFPISETQNNPKLIEQIHQSVDEVKAQFKGKVEVTVFGASLVSQTNSQQIKRDSFIAILLSLIFIVALLIYYYRNFKSILLILCTITFGGLLALGLIAWIKNPISLVAVGVASIIIGIAVNYPIHFLSHFKRTENKELIIREVVTPLLIGNITTVGAFLSLMFISSDAMRDLGLFAALLLVGTILFVLLFLPHFMGKRPKNWKLGELSFRRVAEFHPEKHPWLIVLVILLTGLFFVFSFKTSFETDMHKINYMTEEQQEAFGKLVAEADTTVQTVFCVAEGDTPEAALRNFEKAAPVLEGMVHDSLVQKSAGISVFIPSQKMQKERIDRWSAFWKNHRDTFLLRFKAAEANTGWQPFNDFYEIIEKEYQPQNLNYFAPITQNVASSYVVFDNDKSLVYNILTVKKEKHDVVEEKLNHIDDHVFAFAETSVIQRMVNALSGDFDYVLYICGFIVFVFLLFSFGRIEIALSAFVPLTVAWIWILGIMGLFDLKFNIVNIILATFIFGQGDDYAIFVTEGVMYEYRTGKKMLAQFKNSIILSSTIMFIGIGMLIFAKHPAMRSLAEVTIIGMVSVVMMAYIFPPLIFKWLTSVKGKLRPVPITLWNLLKTWTAFLIFFLISLFLSAWAFICRLLFPRSPRVKAHFHRMLTRILRKLAQWMFEVKCEVRNPAGETFEKPAVIIANHQAHLDLLYTLMLSPKIVVLTNKWVWNCPFYRWIIRYADFLPIADGIEENLSKLEALVNQGYSVLVFPEGTRSADCSILRFHQGAFWLANKLGLDIVPIVNHGIGHVFPKNEFILRKGKVTVSVLPRIAPDHTLRQHDTLLETARAFRKMYISEYQNICKDVETADYFRYLVRGNYLYKGTEVARHARAQLKHFEEWERRIAALPDSGTLLVRNCGQGEFALLVALVKKDLQVTATDPNSDLLDIAAHCAAVPANLHFTDEPEGEYGEVIDLQKDKM